MSNCKNKDGNPAHVCMPCYRALKQELAEAKATCNSWRAMAISNDETTITAIQLATIATAQLAEAKATRDFALRSNQRLIEKIKRKRLLANILRTQVKRLVEQGQAIDDCMAITVHTGEVTLGQKQHLDHVLEDWRKYLAAENLQPEESDE